LLQRLEHGPALSVQRLQAFALAHDLLLKVLDLEVVAGDLVSVAAVIAVQRVQFLIDERDVGFGGTRSAAPVRPACTSGE